MIYSKHSLRSLDDVAKRLEEAAARHNFGILHVLDLQKTLDAKGIQLGAECRVFDVCNAQAAAMALRTDMSVSTVLPCRISVFSQQKGCTIATVRPRALFQATGLSGAESLAAEVEIALLAIIDEAV